MGITFSLVCQPSSGVTFGLREVRTSYNIPLTNVCIYMYMYLLGDYIVVEPILEGDKVKAEIVHILYPKQIKDLKEEKKW